LKRAKRRIAKIQREKDMLLDRLTRYEPMDSSDSSESSSSSDSDSDVSSDSSGDGMTNGKQRNGNKGAESSGVSTPPAARRRKSNKPVVRRAPVVTRTRRIQQIPLDAEGKPVLPLQIGIITIYSLGSIVWDNENFHSERYIYPVGYLATRQYLSMVDPNKVVAYRCSVTEEGGHPRFHVVPEDCPERAVVAGTPTGAWSGIIKAANALRQKDHSNSASGPEFFGFTHPTVAAIIQGLLNADKCKNYVWQNFEVIKGRGSKKLNTNPTSTEPSSANGLGSTSVPATQNPSPDVLSRDSSPVGQNGVYNGNGVSGGAHSIGSRDDDDDVFGDSAHRRGSTSMSVISEGGEYAMRDV